MNRLFYLLLFFFIAFKFSAQSGPAGVGSPITNVFWLKADQGTNTTTNGAAVSTWSDQSGNGIHLTQTVTAQQPSYVSNVINGFPAVLLDNVSGATQADRMGAPDNSKLENTSGYSFFTVSRMTNIGGDARCIISKRTAIDVDEAFMLFYWNSNFFYVDIDGLGDRFNTSPTTYTTNTNYILNAFYDGTLPAASRSSVWEQEILRKTSSETSTLVPDKPSPLNLGCTHQADGRAFGGYIAEVIIYTVAVNPAQRVILNNYLSAKYNIALSSNDKYQGDNPVAGDYDREVAGIGCESSGCNPSFSASVSGGLTISSISGLDASDYILAGHASTLNVPTASDVGGMTGSFNARWLRIWYLDITNTGNNINTNIEFDFSDGGMPGSFPGIASNYVLLYRATQTGNWTELVTASAISGDRVIFNSYNLVNDGYYTLGTRDFNVSPLPVTLGSFTGEVTENGNVLHWTTINEYHSSHFSLDVSEDGVNFHSIGRIEANGNSTLKNSYYQIHMDPAPKLNYYRLTENSIDGSISRFPLIVLDNSKAHKLPVKRINFLGQIVGENFEGPHIIIYQDGSAVKKIN